MEDRQRWYAALDVPRTKDQPRRRWKRSARTKEEAIDKLAVLRRMQGLDD